MLKAANSSLYAIDVIVGIVDERGQTETMHGAQKVVRLESLANMGNLAEVADGNEGLDRIEFTPTPEDGFVLPKSYGGTSGGGCFRALLSKPPNPRVVDFFLAGIAYWETKVDGKADKLICHGPSTIYDRMMPAIREKYGARD